MCAYIASKEYILIRKVAIQLQACWRGIAACKKFKKLRRKLLQVMLVLPSVVETRRTKLLKRTEGSGTLTVKK
ncbi:myosin-17-like protein [Tanacetum coccineum]